MCVARRSKTAIGSASFLDPNTDRAPFTLAVKRFGDHIYLKLSSATLVLTVSYHFVPVSSMYSLTRPLGPMHACLHVDEIVRLIANELVASQDRTTAVALARSCRGFEDPVLDALWGTYHQLAPLLKTFPEDIWNDKSERTVSV